MPLPTRSYFLRQITNATAYQAVPRGWLSFISRKAYAFAEAATPQIVAALSVDVLRAELDRVLNVEPSGDHDPIAADVARRVVASMTLRAIQDTAAHPSAVKAPRPSRSTHPAPRALAAPLRTHDAGVPTYSTSTPNTYTNDLDEIVKRWRATGGSHGRGATKRRRR